MKDQKRTAHEAFNKSKNRPTATVEETRKSQIKQSNQLLRKEKYQFVVDWEVAENKDNKV